MEGGAILSVLLSIFTHKLKLGEERKLAYWMFDIDLWKLCSGIKYLTKKLEPPLCKMALNSKY